MALHVLVGDDAIGFRFVLQTALENAGVERVTLCERWSDVSAAAAAEQPDAILVDLLMPTLDLDALARTRAGAPDAVLAVISSYGRDEVVQQVEDTAGVDLVFSKRERTSEIARQLIDAVTERRAGRPPAG